MRNIKKCLHCQKKVEGKYSPEDRYTIAIACSLACKDFIKVINPGQKVRILNPTKKSKKDKKRGINEEEAPLFEEVQILLSHCRNDIEYMMIFVGWNLYLRSVEIVSLRVKDFNFKIGKVFIRSEIAKTPNSLRYIPFSPSFASSLLDYFSKYNLEKEHYLLNYYVLHPNNPENRLKPYSTWRVRTMAKNIGKRSDMPKFHTHMLRHGGIRYLLMNNTPHEFVSKCAGHHSPAFTLEWYGHFSQKMMDTVASVYRMPLFEPRFRKE